MKKLLALLLVFTALFLLTACRKDGNGPVNTTTAFPAASTDPIGNTTTPADSIPETTAGNDTQPSTTHTHAYSSAVTSVATCTVDGLRTYACSCGETYTEAIPAAGHVWTSSTCAQPQVCSICNEPSGVVFDHAWVDATCTMAKYCANCYISEGSPLDHSWISATCTQAQHCSMCGEQVGSVADHSWIDATCTQAQHCSVCGETTGSTISHSYSNGKCTMCSKSDPNIVSIKVQGLPSSIYGYGTITEGTAYKSGNTIYLTVTIKRTGSHSGSISWELFGGGYQYNKSGRKDAPSSASVGSTFTVTITIPNVPEYSSYKIYVY